LTAAVVPPFGRKGDSSAEQKNFKKELGLEFVPNTPRKKNRASRIFFDRSKSCPGDPGAEGAQGKKQHAQPERARCKPERKTDLGKF